MYPDEDATEELTLTLDGPTIRACYEALRSHDDEMFEADSDNIVRTLRNAEQLAEDTTPDGDEVRWATTLTRIEWVALYGSLYTLPERDDRDNTAMTVLLSKFDDRTTRLAEHTRDFHDAISEELE